MADYLKKIKDEDDRSSGLIGRMDADVNLLRAKYTMADDKGHTIPDIVNVTLNKVSMFAAFATSELHKAVQQIVVESDEKNFDTAYVEEFQEAALASANDRLRRQGKVQLNSFFDVQNCIRGRSAARCLFYMDGDNLITDITPWDAMYVRYGMGADGLDWASYEMERAKDDIESQPWAIEKGFTISGKKAKVIDVWNTEGNIVYVDKKIVYEQEHNFEFCPVALRIVPLGYGAILLGEDSAQYEGESIFFLIRELIPELNRVISISQTLNLKAVKPPIVQKLKGAASREQSDYKDVMDSGATTAIEPDEAIQPIEYGDIRASFDRAYNILEKAIQEGSLTNIDIGDPKQPFSAVALIEMGETRGQVLLPRLAGKSLLNESLAEMFTKQVIQLGGSVELGASGHKRTFQTSKLDGEYSTEYKYFIKSPKEDIARYSIAAAAGPLISNKTKRETILQLEDPDGEQRQLDIEDAERLFPAIKADRVIKSLYEEGREYEAELASAQMGMELQAVLRGEVPEVEPREEPAQVQATAPMPKLGIGDEKTSARKAAELKATPRGGA